MMVDKELLFSVSASDCEWSYTRGTGAGGQKRNKTSSAVHCMHRPSGAHGYSEGSRSQAENKAEAFTRMFKSKEFQKWHLLEIMRRSGQMRDIDAYIDREMKKVRVEMRVDGKWTPWDENNAT